MIKLFLGLAVYGYSKLIMLQFIYDVLGKYADPKLYYLLESDTDSLYLTLGKPSFDEIIKPELKAEYESIKHKYFVIDEEKDRRTPGLLKVEFVGTEMICLTSKTYCVRGETEDKSSSKGLMKRSNIVDIEAMRSVLENKKAGVGINTGFINSNLTIKTYVQPKFGLSYLYIKRITNADGVTTSPLEL